MTAVSEGLASKKVIRSLEILCGSLSWAFLIFLLVLSRFSILATAYILIAYTFFWLLKIGGYSNRLVRGYWYMRLSQKIDWHSHLKDLRDINKALEATQRAIKRQKGFIKRRALKYYRSRLLMAQQAGADLLDPGQLYHAVIVMIYNEDPAILESTIQTLVEAKCERKKMLLVVAYEERGGPVTEEAARSLVKKYGTHFGWAEAIKHPANVPGEPITKAANMNCAGRALNQYIDERGIDPGHVIVTTLDTDHRPDPEYFAYLSFLYAKTPERIHRSYQPIPMFFNNIWDAPALMRVIAVSNSFWVLMESLRPHRLRNFAAHSQSLQTLIDTDYWNVKSIVEDGHQYWRTYFRYHGDHKVLPVFLPVYQDAVLADGYWKTFKAQFYQLRRWAWGVSDTPFVIIKSFRDKNIPWSNKGVQIFRQIEGYFSWAVASIVLAVGGWLPLFLNTEADRSIIAQQLPDIISWIQSMALAGLIAPVASSLLSLPPKPPRYGHRRSLMMILQWLFMPITLIGFGSGAALNTQTRLLFAKYLGEFNVTEKKRIHEPPAIKK